MFFFVFLSKNHEIVASSLHRTHILRYGVQNCLLGFYTASLFVHFVRRLGAHVALKVRVRGLYCVMMATGEGSTWSLLFETFQVEVLGGQERCTEVGGGINLLHVYAAAG